MAKPKVILPEEITFTPDSKPSTFSPATESIPILPNEVKIGEFQDLKPTGADFGLLSGMNQAANRANNQSWTDQLGNFLVNSVAEVAGGTIEGLGYLADFEQHVNLIRGTEDEFANWFSDLGKGLKETTKENFPIYEYQPGGFNPSDTGWWFNNGVSVFSSLSLLIPARGATGIVSGIGKALGAGKAITKTARLLGKEGEALNIAVKAAKQNAKGITAALLSRTMENTMEASQSFEEVYNTKLQEGVPEEEARAAAAQAGRDTWVANSAMLLQDIPQYLFIFKAPGLLKSQGKQYQKMFGKASLKDYGLTMLSEGAEEAYQNIVSKEATGRQLEKEFANTTLNERLSNYVQDADFWNSVVWGGLGGGVAAVFGRAMENKSIKSQQTNNYIAQQDAILSSAINNDDSIQDVKDVQARNIISANQDNLGKIKQEIEDIEPELEDDAQKKAAKDLLSDVEVAEQIKPSLVNLSPQHQHLATNLAVASNQSARRIDEISGAIEGLKALPAVQQHIKKNGEESFRFHVVNTALKQFNKLRAKYKNNPYALSAIDKLEKEYQSELDSFDAKSNVPVPTVGSQIESFTNSLLEQEINFDVKNNQIEDIKKGKTEWIDKRLEEVGIKRIEKSSDVNELQEQRNSENEAISKAAKKRLNELYKQESQILPEDISQLEEFYQNNPATFLAHKKQLWNVDENMSLEDFIAETSNQEFQEKYNSVVSNQKQVSKIKEKTDKVKEEIDAKKVQEKPEVLGTLTDEGTVVKKEEKPEDVEQVPVEDEYQKDVNAYLDNNPKASLKEIQKRFKIGQARAKKLRDNYFNTNQETLEEIPDNDDFIISQEQEFNDDVIVSMEGLAVNSDSIVTPDAMTYTYDNGLVKLYPTYEKLTEQQFKDKYSKLNKEKGYHVLYDKNGAPVFAQDDMFDYDWLRTFSEHADLNTPVSLIIDQNASNVKTKWTNKKAVDKNDYQNVQIQIRIGDKVLGVLPSVFSVSAEQQGEFLALRKQIFEAFKQSGQEVYTYPVQTTLKSILPGRFWKGTRTTNIKSVIAEPIFGIAKGGILLIPNSNKLSEKEQEELKTSGVSDGNIYLIFKNPVTGKYVPYRVFTKKVREVKGKEEQIRKVLSTLNPSNVKEVSRELEKIVRWRDSKGKIHPDIFYSTKSNQYTTNIDGEYINFNTAEEYFGIAKLGDKTVQVDSNELNRANYTNKLIEEGVMEIDLNPNLIHSPKFYLDIQKLYSNNKVETRSETSTVPKKVKKVGGIKFKKSGVTSQPRWNQKEETAWFKEKIGELIDFNVVSESELDSIVESLKHIHGQDNLKAWGFFHNAAVWISDNAVAGVVFHEAYHAVETLVLTQKQIENLNQFNTEEDRADLFAEYVQKAQIDEQKLKQSSFFKQLGNLVKRYFRKMYLAVKAAVGLNLSQQEIFFRINEGSYKNNVNFKRNVETFKPSVVKAFPNPVKQMDRINLVNKEFIDLYNQFKSENKDVPEKDLVKRAIDVKSKDNLFKELADIFRGQAEYINEEDLTQEEKDYKIAEYNKMADLLWTDKPNELYYNAIDKLDKYGISVKTLKEDVEFIEEEQHYESWMDINLFPIDSFTGLLKQGLSTLIDGNFTGNNEVDENGVETGYKEVDYSTDDLGYARPVDMDEVYNKLLEETVNAQSVEEVLSIIKDISETLPWAVQLHKVLSGHTESVVITNPDLFLTQLYYNASQQADPDSKLLLEKWEKGKHVWRFINSNTVGLVNKLKTRWYENMDNITINKFRTGSGYNEEKVNKSIEVLEANPENKSVLHKLLNELGIDVPMEALISLERSKKLKNLYKGVKTLMDNLVKNNAAKNTAIEQIAKLVKNYYPEYHLSNHTNVAGEMVSNYIRSSFMHRQITKFKKGDTEFYRTDPFYERNDKPFVIKPDGTKDTDTSDYDLWLDRFETDSRKKLSFNILDGIKYANGQGTQFADMSDKEFLLFILNAFYNSGNGTSYTKGIGKGYFSAQLMADSSSHALIGFETYASDMIVKKLVKVAQAELRAIQDFRLENPNVKNYNPKFNFFPELTEEDVLSEDLSDKINKKLNTLYEKVLSDLVEEGILVKTDKGYESKILDANIKDIESFVKEFVYNDYYAQTQIVSLFHGNLSFYKSMEDFYKRAKEIWSPGNFIDATAKDINGIPINPQYFSVFVQSELLNYDNNKEAVDAIMDSYRKAGLPEDEVIRQGAKFGFYNTEDGEVKLSDGTIIRSGNTDSTDAQGIITIDRWKEIQLGKGTDPVEVERIYDLAKTKKLSDADVTTVLNPIKQFYYGLTKINNKVIPTQIKNSEYVLLPQIAEKNPELQKVLDKLDEVKKETGLNGSINFNSAVKVGERNTVQTIDEIVSQRAIILNNSEYRIQGEVPEHQIDADSKLGTQLRKLIIGDLNLEDLYEVAEEQITGEELREEWNNLIVADIEDKMNSLMDTFDNPVEFYKMLQEEAKKRDYPDQYVDGLTLVNGKPKLPLSSPMLFKKSVSLISAIFRNRITTINFKGATTPNVTAYGFEREPQIVFNEDGSVKHFEAYFPMTSSWLNKYMDKNGFISEDKIKELEKLGLDLGVAYRIPTENKYSMVPFKIIGFVNSGIVLPKTITTLAGLDFDIDKMFVMLYSFDVLNGKPVKAKWSKNPSYEDYKNRVLKSKEAKKYIKDEGYDVEDFIGLNKTSQIFNEIGKTLEGFFNSGFQIEDLLPEDVLLPEAEWNQLSIYEKNTISARHNRMLDIVRAVLTNKNTITDQLIPGGFEELKEHAYNIAEKKGKNKVELQPASILTRKEIFRRMMAGKKLIGIAANYNATHPLMQDSDLKLTTPVLFDGKSETDLGKVYVEIIRANTIEDFKVGDKIKLYDTNVTITSITDNNITVEVDSEDGEGAIHKMSHNSFLEKTSGTGVTITSEIAQFLASVVDNGKDPLANLYNLNTYTADVAMLITKLYGKETAMNFIAQPSIVKFYKRYVNYGEGYEAEREAAEDSGISNYNDIRKGKVTASNFDTSELFEHLSDKPDDKYQLEVLKTFLVYKNNQAKDLSQLVAAIKVPDNGMRSTLEATLSGVDLVNDMTKIEGITGIVDFLTKKSINNSLYENGIIRALNYMTEKLNFPDYTTGGYKSMREWFSELKGFNLNEKELSLLHDAAMTYISAGHPALRNIDKRKVIVQTPVILQKLKDANPVEYRKFLNSLKIEDSVNDNQKKIISMDNGHSREAENDIIEQWRTMFDSKKVIMTYNKVDITESDLAKMLSEYAFITNGFRFSPGSLAHIQPIDVYLNLDGQSYGDYIVQQFEGIKEDEYFFDKFKDQFIRHYFPRLSYVKEYDETNSKVKFTNNEPFTIRLDLEKDTVFYKGKEKMPDYIKMAVKNPETKKKDWYLFSHKNNGLYTRAEQLGLYREFEEWSYDELYPRSLFKVNRLEENVSQKADKVMDVNKPQTLQERMTQKLPTVVSDSAKKHVPKELVKTRVATQFIGAGAPGSSSDRYRQMYAEENRANTGEYSSTDIIFVASNGKRNNRINPVVNGELQGSYRNIEEAMKASASFIMDTKQHLESTKNYNIGELALAEYMQNNGYERQGDSGLWKPVKTSITGIPQDRGTLPMQVDNIKKIKNSKKYITNRTEKLDDGVYALPDGTKVEVIYLAKFRYEPIDSETGAEKDFDMGDFTVTEVSPNASVTPYKEFFEAIQDRDAFAYYEGFPAWNEFAMENKFSENFVKGNQSRYVYYVQPVNEITEDNPLNDKCNKK